MVLLHNYLSLRKLFVFSQLFHFTPADPCTIILVLLAFSISFQCRHHPSPQLGNNHPSSEWSRSLRMHDKPPPAIWHEVPLTGKQKSSNQSLTHLQLHNCNMMAT